MHSIFLDTAQIGLLEKARRTEPVRYSRFRDAWRQRECVLVITMAQMTELRRYEDASRRAARYEVLADLVPIITDFRLRSSPVEPRTLLDREIIGRILDRGISMSAPR